VPTFMLETAFTEQDLERFLASGSNVVVARPAGGGIPNVAWVVHRPLLANTVTWQESYGIYASSAEIVNGAQLTQMSQTPYPAHADATYALNPAGFFGPPCSGGVRNAYSAVNEYDNRSGKGYLTMGLYQDASVNGVPAQGNAVSAAPVIYRSTAVMTPFTTVYLWIQSATMSNTIVTRVTSPVTKVTFGPVTDAALRYDASSGIFLPLGGDEPLGAGIRVDHVIPSLI
jgi:hypothetical protein